jgi:hypothetical protein
VRADLMARTDPRRLLIQKVLIVLALGLGGLITWVDTRSTWDDTGVTAAAMLVIAGVLGFLGPRRAWIWALALGIWTPLIGIVRTHNYTALLALAMAFAGAYGGVAIRGWLSRAQT